MKDLIIVRGGGDIATGTIYKLKKCGFSVLILEIAHPSAIRRNVAFSEAVYEDHSKVEDMECFLAKDEDEAERFLKDDKLTMLIDPKADGSGRCDSCQKESWNHTRYGTDHDCAWTGIYSRSGL